MHGCVTFELQDFFTGSKPRPKPRRKDMPHPSRWPAKLTESQRNDYNDLWYAGEDGKDEFLEKFLNEGNIILTPEEMQENLRWLKNEVCFHDQPGRIFLTTIQRERVSVSPSVDDAEDPEVSV